MTNTLVAMGHFAHKDELRRGFAGATMHDCFNLLSVLVILPFQWATDFLGHLSYAMAKGADVSIITCCVLDSRVCSFNCDTLQITGQECTYSI